MKACWLSVSFLFTSLCGGLDWLDLLDTQGASDCLHNLDREKQELKEGSKSRTNNKTMAKEDGCSSSSAHGS